MKQHIFLRATIFTDTIPFTQENAKKFPFGDDWDYNWFSFNPAQPVNTFSLQDGEKLFNNGAWNAVQKGAKYSILFQENKIDVYCNNSTISIADFISCVKTIFVKLSSAYGFTTIARFAFAPTYGSTDVEWNRIFVNSTFKGSNRSEFSMQFVFRSTESINNERVVINNLVHVNSGLITDQTGVHNALIYQLDINSFPGVIHSIDTMLSFFDNAESFATEVLTHLGY